MQQPYPSLASFQPERGLATISESSNPDKLRPKIPYKQKMVEQRSSLILKKLAQSRDFHLSRASSLGNIRTFGGLMGVGTSHNSSQNAKDNVQTRNESSPIDNGGDTLPKLMEQSELDDFLLDN